MRYMSASRQTGGRRRKCPNNPKQQDEKQVYVKFYTARKVNKFLNHTNGRMYFEHTNSMMSQVSK